MFLLAGFALGRSANERQRARCYGALAFLVGALAIWSVLQLALGEKRGHALFEAASTHATVVNAALAPTLVAIVLFGANWRLVVLGGILFAGLCATGSRGGFLALAGGMAVAWIWVHRANWHRRSIALVALLFGCGVIAVALAGALGSWEGKLGEPAGALANLDSARSRLELYELAWSTSSFGLGIGYLAFRYVLEIGREQVPSYSDNSFTYFVHNDYLQTLLELGWPGLVALLAMVLLAVRARAWGAPSTEKERHESTAVLAGVLTIALHAAVDFPLHVPLCLLLFGFGLGVLDRLSAPDLKRDVPAAQPQRLATLILALALTTLLARSVISEAASSYAARKWLVGETRAAAYGFELARRIDSGDWRHHLYAGQFWFAQAADNNEPEQARLADAAFAAAMAANPLEPTSVLGRVLTQLTYHSILPSPAPPALVRAWAEQARMLAPLSPEVRKEYERIQRRLPPG